MNDKHKLVHELVVSVIPTGIIIVLVTISPSIALVRADSINPGVYSKDDKPYGLTYGQWTANFWKWMISIPEGNNPNNDPTGEKCATNQGDRNVWYLAPTFGGSAERTCTMPSGKAILFPLLVSECNPLENPGLKTDAELRSCAMQANDQGSRSMEVILDGVRLRNLENYRVQSELFDLSFPEHNAFSVKPGSTKAISDGFWVFLKPLPAGKHELEFSASIIDPTSVNNYNTHVKDHLIVRP
jgi:hypothetical protein